MASVQSNKSTRSARVREMEAGNSVGSGDDLHIKPVRQIGRDASNLELYGFMTGLGGDPFPAELRKKRSYWNASSSY